MKDDEITALAKGVAPFVRECVADALKDVLDVRLADLEARAPVPGPAGPQGEAGVKGEVGPRGESADILLSPELAQQVANAVRLLHESPPITEEQKAPPRIVRVKRDDAGNFVPVYDGDN